MNVLSIDQLSYWERKTYFENIDFLIIGAGIVGYSAAIELATNSEKLKSIQVKLKNNRLTTPLFNTPLFTKHIELGYKKVYEQYQSDLPPEHFYIDVCF